MKTKVLLLLSIAAFAFAVSDCGDKGGSTADNTPEPYIQSISTEFEGNKAVAGKPVTLLGLNFSPVAAENKVLYGVGLDAVALRVSESTAERIVFNAPDLDRTQLRIRVSVNGKESNSVVLEYADNSEEPWSDEPTISLPGATTVKVRDGIEWTSFHGKWEGQIRNINIVRTTLNSHNKLGLYFNYDKSYPDGYDPQVKEDEDPRDLDKKCIYLDAIVGTNGPMACCQFVRVDGEVKHSSNPEAHEWICNCALTIDKDVVDIVKVKSDVNAARLTNDPDGDRNPPKNTLTVGCAGPLLVWEGKLQPATEEWLAIDEDKWLTDSNPRTAIGLSSDGKTVVQVAVDGRWTKNSGEIAYGMSTDLLGKLMRGLGCYKAMNFDGGGGTAMWVYGYGNSRNIVNRVSENRFDANDNWVWNWNGTRLRPAGCAVYIKSDLK